MSVDYSSVIAYGRILTEEEYYFLEEKFGDYLWEKLEEGNADYPFHLICRNSYTDKKRGNYMLGDEILHLSDGCFAKIEPIVADEVDEKEIREEIEKLLGKKVEYGHYAFVKVW